MPCPLAAMSRFPSTARKLLDTDLVEYFKAQAGERDYQTLIDETLRQAVQSEELEDRLRRILREEMHRQSG